MEWLAPKDNDGMILFETQQRRFTALNDLEDIGGLYKLLGEAIIRFIQKKVEPFPYVMDSKANFWQMEVWKRAYIHIHLTRVVTKNPCNKQWKNWSVDCYKLNVRTFRRYVANDRAIISSSRTFNQLPEVCSPPKKKRRTSMTKSPSSSAYSVAVACTTFDVNTDSSGIDLDEWELHITHVCFIITHVCFIIAHVYFDRSNFGICWFLITHVCFIIAHVYFNFGICWFLITHVWFNTTHVCFSKIMKFCICWFLTTHAWFKVCFSDTVFFTHTCVFCLQLCVFP